MQCVFVPYETVDLELLLRLDRACPIFDPSGPQKTLDLILSFYDHRNMEREVVCFPEPLNACIPLTYGGSLPAEPDPPEKWLYSLDELFGED